MRFPHLPVVLICLLLAVRLVPVSTSAQNSGSSSVQTTNLHQWGAVTLFHGLPSDRVRAIAQGADGALWFGTDNGLARYDGRRTQSIAVEGLGAAGRVLVLKFDEGGALWAGTDAGGARLANGVWRAIEETKGQSVTAILARGPGRALLATTQGQIFDCGVNADGSISARAVFAEALRSADADQPGALELTSLVASEGGAFYAGTHSRGLLSVEGGEAKEINSRPRAYFVEALERDSRGVLWFGARARGSESGLYEARDAMRPSKIETDTGTVTALRAGGAGGRGEEGAGSVGKSSDLWVGTAGRGVFRFRDGRFHEHYTFEGTAGGLRSNQIYSIHVDREGVVWFGTDRGVCRFDERSPRNERLAEDAESNFVRVLYRTRAGKLLCGTNRGLFVRDEGATWRAVAELERQSVYAIAEDAAGRLLVGSSGGLYTDVDLKSSSRVEESLSEPPEETADARNNAAQAEANEAALDDGADAPGAAKPEKRDAARRRKQDEQKARSEKKTRAASGFSVRAIRIFQGATYVAAYGRGVERVEGKRRTLVWPAAGEANAELRQVTTLHVEEERAGKPPRLWIGTAGAGLYILENSEVAAAGGEFDKLKGSAIRAIEGSATGGGGLWFGTVNGLYYLDKGSLIEFVKGLEVRAVVASVRRDGSAQAWCATAGGGLLRASLVEGVGVIVSRLDAEQGLASANAFALLRIGAGDVVGGNNDARSVDEETLLLGTNRGLTFYTPGTHAPALVPARILSSRVHQPEEMRGGIELPYPQDNLTLEVAALGSRTFPEQFQYAFMLTGAHGEEIKRQLSHDGEFLLENLSPGRYRVEARAFTKDLVASAPLAFDVTIGSAPFPWTTTLLAVLLVLALVALTWGAVQNRKIARTGAALQQAHHDLAGARLNLANEAERERRRIARDLHDQTLADLRSLLLLTDQMPAGDSQNKARGDFDPAIFRAEIESVSNEIRRICEDLSPSALDNVGLGAALEWAISNAVAHLPPPQKFEYEFLCDEDLDERAEFQPGERMQIYRIAQEAVSNVCRHAAATRVSLIVNLTDAGDLLLMLEDDGRGFDPADRRAKKGRGISGIRARASLIEADVSWKRKPGGGTIFKLRKAKSARGTGGAGEPRS